MCIPAFVSDGSHEGLLFTDPTILTDKQAIEWIKEIFPSTNPAVYEEIQKYYPSPQFGTTRYSTEFGRIKSIIEGLLHLKLISYSLDSIVNCNCLYLARAFKNNTHNYRFSIPPGIHAMDLIFTFYPMTITLPTNLFVLPIPLLYARALQSCFISFVKHGDPNVERRRGTIEWHLFGKEKRIVDVTLLGFWGVKDNQLSEDYCRFWQTATYSV